MLSEGLSGEAYVRASKELAEIEPLVARVGDLRAAERAQAEAEILLADPEMHELAETELRDPGIVDLQSKDDDPHLRSIEAVTGYHVHAIDGEIGHVEDLIIEDAGWSVRYIKVDTRNQWPENRVLISPRSIRNIDWKARLVYLDVNRQKVQNSPPYDPSTTVDGAYDETFLTYYGIRWVQP
jgi:hypothetical protein